MVCAEDVKRLCLQLESKSTKGEHWPRAGTSQQDRGVLVTASRGEASLSPLLICTVAPRWDGRPFCCSSRSIVNTPELSDTTGLPGELSSNRAGLITSAEGSRYSLQMVWWGEDFFISPSSFSGRATGDSALNLSLTLLTFQVFTDLRVTNYSSD